MENHETLCEPKEEIDATPLEKLAALLNMGGEETSPPSHLDPHRSNIVIGERPFLRGLQGAAFQTLMECKEKDLVWEDGSPHERSTKMMEKRWQDVYIIGQQGEGIHISDMKYIYISVMIPSSHESYDVSMRRHQALELLGIDGREHK